MMKELVAKALEKAQDYSTIETIKSVQGGSINESFYIKTRNARYFLKYHHIAPEKFFEVEAEGLRNIRQTDTIAVPDVLAFSDEKNNSFLLLDWIQGEKKNNTEVMLGENIAKLHMATGPAHGFYNDTFIGTLAQANELIPNWLNYYRDYRLIPQLNAGIKNNRINARRRKQMEKLLDHLNKWIPEKVAPSYLHGDLWGGNWITGPNGEPYVIDPSFLYGDRHFDIAFTELFGGFSNQFYQAYNEQFPLSDYYTDIKPLYQLYYLLVHVNIFGESYGAHVDTVLNYYAGK